jgi:hypothetical protein
VELKPKPALPDDEAPLEETASRSPAPAASDVADLTVHLLKARMRVAVESLEAAERLLRGRSPSHEAHAEAQRLIESARREMESLKSLLRGDGSSGGVL